MILIICFCDTDKYLLCKESYETGFGGGVPIPLIIGATGGILAILLCVGAVCVKWSRRRKVFCLNIIADSTQGS